MKEGYKSAVSLDDLLIKVKLGVTDKEKDVLQDIKVSFKFFFPELPVASQSDDINDTVCYHKMASIVEEYCTKNSCRTLEHLCFQLHSKLKEVVDNNIKIWIKVEKCKPPIRDFKGVTAFEYED